ncbi:AAA family ATPase, partial [Streptomyces sp. NPDC086766]|uniref:AAA family ATPase n=1 Tax=Streptomyces sp. NPDC086766 TaxID=3365754 RepID=UPI00381C5F07
MNPHPFLTYGQVLPPGQNRHPVIRQLAIDRHPERTPTQHSSTPARSASTRRSNREVAAGDQEATSDAMLVLHAVLEPRLARGLTCVVDAASPNADVRRRLIEAAHAHQVPAAAVVMTAPLEQCLTRNARLLRFSAWGRWVDSQAGGGEAAVDQAGPELDSA